MTFDRRLTEGGQDEAVARAHADALREALIETVATKTDLEAVRVGLEHKVELTARDLSIRGAAGLTLLVGVIVGLKLFG